jgi:hypothetical protein
MKSKIGGRFSALMLGLIVFSTLMFSSLKVLANANPDTGLEVACAGYSKIAGKVIFYGHFQGQHFFTFEKFEVPGVFTSSPVMVSNRDLMVEGQRQIVKIYELHAKVQLPDGRTANDITMTCTSVQHFPRP